MIDLPLRMLLGATLGLALVLLLRRGARRLFGAAPAFALWLLPAVMALAPLLPQAFAPPAIIALPGLTVTPRGAAQAAATAAADPGWLWLTVWLAGAAIGVARLTWQYVALRRGARRGSAAWLARVALELPSVDLRRVRLHAAGPAVLWALPRSLLLLPTDFTRRFGRAEARALVLQHELAHLRRGDAWWALGVEIASAFLWFHPLVWLARPRFRLDQELACDATALRASRSPSAGYARALLESVAAGPVIALIPWLAEPHLKERIAMLAKTAPGALRRRAGFVTTFALLAGGVWLAGGQAPAWAAGPTASRATRATIRITSPGPGGSPTSAPTVDVSYKNRNPPRYPVEAIKKGEQGNVVLDVTVDATGAVTGVQVDRHGTNAAPVLQVAAMQAAANWKFNPGRADGKATGGVVRIPVTFSLSGWAPTAEPFAPCPVGDVYDARVERCVPSATTH